MTEHDEQKGDHDEQLYILATRLAYLRSASLAVSECFGSSLGDQTFKGHINTAYHSIHRSIRRTEKAIDKLMK